MSIECNSALREHCRIASDGYLGVRARGWAGGGSTHLGMHFIQRALQVIPQRLAGIVDIALEYGAHQGFMHFDEMLRITDVPDHDVAIATCLIVQ